MATFTAPVSHASVEPQLGRNYELVGDRIDQELAEQFDPTMGSLVVRLADLAGSGTDTTRVRRTGGWGWDNVFAAMGGETDAIVASAISGAFDALSIARYGLAYEETFQQAILSDSIRLDDDYGSVESFVQSYLALHRSLLCTTGATISTNAADSAATLDVDDMINLRALYHETEGFSGRPVVMLKPRQFSALTASMRTETALATSDLRFDADQGIRANSGQVSAFLGFDIYTSNDVVASSGDDVGFSYVPGAIGYGVGGTQDMGDLEDARAVTVPDWGIVITTRTVGQQAYKRKDANAWLGYTLLSADVFPQFLLSSDDGV